MESLARLIPCFLFCCFPLCRKCEHWIPNATGSMSTPCAATRWVNRAHGGGGGGGMATDPTRREQIHERDMKRAHERHLEKEHRRELEEDRRQLLVAEAEGLFSRPPGAHTLPLHPVCGLARTRSVSGRKRSAAAAKPSDRSSTAPICRPRLPSECLGTGACVAGIAAHHL